MNRYLILQLLWIFTLCFSPERVFAAQVQKIEPLAEVEFLPVEDFETQTQLIEETPLQDERLSFSMRLPKDWKAELAPLGKINFDPGINKKVLREVARYVSPPRFNLRSFFTMQVMELTYEIGAGDWLVYTLLRSGSTINAMTEYSAKEAEALYVIVEGDTTYIVRTKVFLNGPRVVMIKYFVPQDDYKAERTMQGQAIDSFDLTNKETNGIEEYKSYGFLDQSYFDYPSSWTLKSNFIKSIERMKAYIYRGIEERDDGRITDPDGQIRIHLVSKLLNTRLSDEVKAFRDSIEYPGYTLGDVIDAKRYNYHEDMIKGRAEIYALKPQNITMIPYELIVSVSEGEDYYYFVSMLSPSRDLEYYDWARNMEAFRIVVESLRRRDKEKDDYYEAIKAEENGDADQNKSIQTQE